MSSLIEIMYFKTVALLNSAKSAPTSGGVVAVFHAHLFLHESVQESLNAFILLLPNSVKVPSWLPLYFINSKLGDKRF